MAQSIQNNKEFRAALMSRKGALGSELQVLTGRSFVYSTWSLRCMETETHELWTQKEGKETRYMLKLRPEAKAAREAAKAERAASPKAKAKPIKSEGEPNGASAPI